MPALLIKQILGRNGVDLPEDLPGNMVVEALNIDFYNGGLCRKRLGASNVTLNGFAGPTNQVQSLARYLPSDDETAAQLWAAESNALTTLQVLTGGTTWATKTLANAIQANVPDVMMVNFNGKLFIACNTAVNRLQVMPSASGTIRRVGIAAGAVPTIGVVEAGAITDTRKWAMCFVEQSAGITIRRSNLSPLTAAQALVAQRVPISRPTAPGDGETHWELYGFTTSDNYANGYLLSTNVIATGSINDNTATLSGTAPPLAGANTPPASVKYLLVDGNRLVMAGAWETSAGDGITPSVRRIWWTPRLGTSASDGDDERISNTTSIKGYLDVEAPITGLAGPLLGNIYVFGPRTTWKLLPTDQVDAPYVRITVREDIGCVRQQTIVMAEDENGDPALYWLSYKGFYRTGKGGLQYIGRDVQDRVDLIPGTAANHWGMFLPQLHQIWWHIATGVGQVTPNERLVFDVRLGRVIELDGMSTVHYGWTRHTGNGVKSSAGTLFSNTLGASMSLDLVPYLGNENTTSAAIWKHNTGSQDNGTGYQSSVTTKQYQLQPGSNLSALQDAILTAQAVTGVTLTLLVDGDFGLLAQQSVTAALTPAGSETRVLSKFEGLVTGGDLSFVQFTLQDASPNAGWTADSLNTPLEVVEGR